MIESQTDASNTAPAAGCLLEARNISRRADDGTTLLDGVSMRVAAGERWAVTGPTGSGKTVLLRAVGLLDEVQGGEIRFRDRPVNDRSVPAFRRDVVYLHQRPVIVDGTVEANLRLPFSFHANSDRCLDEDYLRELLNAAGRDAGFLGKPGRELSGGEAQIVALLRAMLPGPSVLLLDEPTAALDAGSVTQVERLVADWMQGAPRERSAVWVSHDTAQVERISDLQLQLSAGRSRAE